MNPIKNSLYLTLLLGLVACSSPDETASVDTPAKDAQADVPQETLELNWEQLMPKGEDKKLEELYANYYAELESKFQQQMEESKSDDAPSDDDGSPQDLVAAIVEGSANDTMEQIGTFNVVKELDGRTVRIPGYVVPFDFNAEAKYQEFLLVPYFGACLHTPPPPPNQIVFVKSESGVTVEDIYEPVWVEGVLKTGEFSSDLASTAYELQLDTVEAYAY